MGAESLPEWQFGLTVPGSSPEPEPEPEPEGEEVEVDRALNLLRRTSSRSSVGVEVVPEVVVPPQPLM